MSCANKILYAVQKGDSLYKIARRYQTTVSQILSDNPHISPNVLYLGDVLTLCPNSAQQSAPSKKGEAPPAKSPSSIPTQPAKPPKAPLPGMPEAQFAAAHASPTIHSGPLAVQLQLNNDMRKAWAQQTMWMRSLLTSIAENLEDKEEVSKRVLRGAGHMTRIFSQYYPTENAEKLKELFTRHLQIGMDFVEAYKTGAAGQTALDSLNAGWYQNADELAAFLASLNPNYDKEALTRMLYQHLDLIKQEIGFLMARKYAADIALYDAIEADGLSIADELTQGIIKQFPNQF